MNGTKKWYGARVRNQTLEEGDRVLVRNLSITGKHKLQDRWNLLPHVVTWLGDLTEQGQFLISTHTQTSCSRYLFN